MWLHRAKDDSWCTDVSGDAHISYPEGDSCTASPSDSIVSQSKSIHNICKVGNGSPVLPTTGTVTRWKHITSVIVTSVNQRNNERPGRQDEHVNVWLRSVLCVSPPWCEPFVRLVMPKTSLTPYYDGGCSTRSSAFSPARENILGRPAVETKCCRVPKARPTLNATIITVLCKFDGKTKKMYQIMLLLMMLIGGRCDDDDVDRYWWVYDCFPEGVLENVLSKLLTVDIATNCHCLTFGAGFVCVPEWCDSP